MDVEATEATEAAVVVVVATIRATWASMAHRPPSEAEAEASASFPLPLPRLPGGRAPHRQTALTCTMTTGCSRRLPRRGASSRQRRRRRTTTLSGVRLRQSCGGWRLIWNG